MLKGSYLYECEWICHVLRVNKCGREKWENGDRAESRDSAMEAWWVFSRAIKSLDFMLSDQNEFY